jgi:hypothetical protein
VSEASFRHEGAVIEAGVERQLGSSLRRSLGPVAMALEREPLGKLSNCRFIAPRSAARPD